ncbi:MAG: ribonuclease catalytic domain-containing protein [Desulfobacterales bacterium]|nr:ribonuclease catalytic domain-containing protein [Desulfobacterales bacterium]
MSLHGKLIEYLAEGRILCALVHEDSGKRLRIFSQNGRELNLPHSRVIHHSRTSYPLTLSREEEIALLKDVAATRQALAATVDLKELWELVVDEPTNVFTASFLAGLSFGHDPDDDHGAAVVRGVLGDKLFFKYKQGNIIAHPPGVVEQLRQRREKEKEQETLLIDGARELKRIWAGDSPGEWPGQKKYLDLVRDYYLHGSEVPEHALARNLLKKAGLTGPHDAFHLLVKADVWDQDENIPLLRQGLEVDFEAAALDQAAAMVPPPVEELLAEGRQDLRDLELLTVDGPATRDFDDALHLEKRGNDYLVGIHITDVAALVRPGTPLFEAARTRVTSLYFPDRQIPMLPSGLSEDLCSLRAGQPRAAMSFMVRISATGEILDFDVKPSVVTVKRQLHYAEADRLVETDETLAGLHRLARQLRRQRLEAGALLLPFPDVNIRITPDKEIEITLAEVDTPGRMLVAEFMILANTLGAQYIAEREAPGLFRSQPRPRQRLVQGEDKDLFLNTRQRKKLAPGSLSTVPRAHSGLGVSQYTTLTSPIRRLLDLVMQIQLQHLAMGKGVFFSKSEIKEFVHIILNTQTRVNGVKFLRHRYWLLKHLESRTGEAFPAIIIDKGQRRAHILVKDFLLDADLPNSQVAAFAAGETIMVRITKADALANVLVLEPTH